MIFKPRQKKLDLDINLELSTCQIERVKETVFLGVVLDEHLSWKTHISNVSRKISKSIGIIHKSRFCLSLSSLRILYYSLVYPYLIYCVSVWASTYPTNLNRITILQKRLVRIIANKPFDAHTKPLFKELQILQFTDIFLFQLGKFMYLFKKGLVPGIFNEMFLINNQIHSYNTRKSNAFHIFPSRTNLRRFAISFQGPKFFNSLNNDVQTAVSISLFKSKLKAFLLS